jgi:hypothetical protein
MALLAAVLLAVCASAAEPVRSIELLPGGSYQINALPAPYVGSGDFKEVLAHPRDSGLVVKVFYNKWAPSLPEKRLEVANIRALEAARAAPALVEHGATMVAGKPAGFVVQERVRGLTMERPTPTKLAEVDKLFKRLAKAGIELGDTKTDFKLRQNIMVGETRSGGFGAWVVDADLVDSKKTPEQLKAFYDGLFSRLSR